MSKLPESSRSPAWVKEMHAYRGRTGEYRPKDAYRVLGDPRTAVTVSTGGSHKTASNGSNTPKKS